MSITGTYASNRMAYQWAASGVWRYGVVRRDMIISALMTANLARQACNDKEAFNTMAIAKVRKRGGGVHR